jgi:hypothetical protein
MSQIIIGGRKINYTTIGELQDAVKTELTEVDKRAKKVGEEAKGLRKARRALISALGDAQSRKKPVATAASSAQ